MGSEGARWGVRGQGRERGGEAGSEAVRQGVRGHVILGFRVPTTCGNKKFNIVVRCPHHLKIVRG